MPESDRGSRARPAQSSCVEFADEGLGHVDVETKVSVLTTLVTVTPPRFWTCHRSAYARRVRPAQS